MEISSFQWFSASKQEAVGTNCVAEVSICISGNTFTYRWLNTGSSCPKRFWVSTTEIINGCPDMVLGTLLWVALLELDQTEVPPNRSHFVILWICFIYIISFPLVLSCSLTLFLGKLEVSILSDDVIKTSELLFWSCTDKLIS